MISSCLFEWIMWRKSENGTNTQVCQMLLGSLISRSQINSIYSVFLTLVWLDYNQLSDSWQMLNESHKRLLIKLLRFSSSKDSRLLKMKSRAVKNHQNVSKRFSFTTGFVCTWHQWAAEKHLAHHLFHVRLEPIFTAGWYSFSVYKTWTAISLFFYIESDSSFKLADCGRGLNLSFLTLKES